MNERIKKSKVTRFFELDILGLLLNLDEQFKINIWTMFSIPVTRDLLSLSVAIALCYYNSQSPMLHHNPLRVRRAEFWDLRSAAYLRKLEVGGRGNMKRVNSCVKSDEHVLEELETEGERQLKSLLQHQLDTSVSIEECMSKKESFAPGTMYKPFGKEAAGTMTLSQFQTLHEKDQETASLRELGLNETEILIWKSHVSGEKKTRLRATPEAIQNRLQDIEERISERQRILCLPQRFAKSKQLTRREMEIEKSLFQGADRHSFLKALYYQDEPQKKNKGDPMNNLESFYQEMIMKKRLEEFQLMRGEPFASHSLVSATSVGDRVTAESPSLLQDKGKQAAQGKGPSLHVANVIDFSPEQCWTGPKKLTQPIEFVPEDEIQRNRLSEEEIRKIPMFSSYNPGEPNKVLYLKNLSPRVTERDLVSLFARFQEKKGPPIQFRMMTGRMRGQAFVTFPNKEIAWQALHLVNGYKLRGKILVIEFGKNKKQRSNLQATSLISCATGEECCYVNQSGIVTEKVREIGDQIQRGAEELQNTGPWDLLSQWMPWILPFLEPLAGIMLLLFFGPCIFNLLVKFVSSRIKGVKLQIVLQMEPQMPSMTKIYCRPLDWPASPCSDVNDLEGTPPKEISTAQPLLCPSSAGSS
ncbi:RNA-binding protein 41 isoform X5 [Chlorocebus sabaeus]|uniref:RNA-binding protein 41 isoform X5 n=2 Tax=Chlorocebus sabaeus TaxID=60711 RepID=UPI0018B090C1|nr:RNA-binding protein 41 isoform X4 [Chlorocebus sabaeus]